MARELPIKTPLDSRISYVQPCRGKRYYVISVLSLAAVLVNVTGVPGMQCKKHTALEALLICAQADSHCRGCQAEGSTFTKQILHSNEVPMDVCR